jgi:hypothetical protein
MPPLNATDGIDDSSFHNEDHRQQVNNRSTSELKSELCRTQVRCEELEHDRNYSAAKATELQGVLNSYKTNDVQQALMFKSMQVAEVSMEVDRLHVQLKKLAGENERIQKERDADRTKMLELSNVVRSLQYASYDSDEEDEVEEEILTPEKALDMTLKNLKVHVECLEEERQRLSLKCKSQSGAIASLNKDNELKEVKINMLEELFRSMNEERNGSGEDKNQRPTPRQPVVPLKKTKSEPRLIVEMQAAVCRRSGFGRLLSVPVLSAPKRAASEDEKVDPTKARRMEVAVNKLEASYTGPIRNGLPHGTGTFRFKSGDTYLGEVVAGEMHGKGTLYHRQRELGCSRGVFEHNVFVGAGL